MSTLTRAVGQTSLAGEAEIQGFADLVQEFHPLPLGTSRERQTGSSKLTGHARVLS